MGPVPPAKVDVIMRSPLLIKSFVRLEIHFSAAFKDIIGGADAALMSVVPLVAL